MGLLDSGTVKKRDRTIPECGACGLLAKCKTPKMGVAGEGRRGVLVVMSAITATADESGVPLAGDVAVYVRSILNRAGWSLDRDCWTTSAIACAGEANTDRVGYCSPILKNTIQRLKPRAIICLGYPATAAVTRWGFEGENLIPSSWTGHKIPDQTLGCWVFPIDDAVFASSARAAEKQPQTRTLFERDLLAALAHVRQPLPDWSHLPGLIRVEYDHTAAARWLAKAVAAGRPFAFDYETNAVKPDSPETHIHYCAVCVDGKRTIAYPYIGDAVEATKALLRTDIPKIAANAKFETRWTRKHSGFWASNWAWDTMLAAHIGDQRPMLTGLCTQAYLRMGIAPWDAGTSNWFSRRSRNDAISETRAVNNITNAPADKILRYVGLDATIEFWLADVQTREMLGKSIWEVCDVEEL